MITARLSVLLLFFALKDATAKNVLILLADDLGMETSISVKNSSCWTPNLEQLAKRSLSFSNAFTSVSSCSPSRAAILSGLPSHQVGMYGLHHDVHHFNAFDEVLSLSNIVNNRTEGRVRTGIIGKKHVGPGNVFLFDFEATEENSSVLQVGRNITLIKDLVGQFLDQLKNENFFLYVAFHDAHRCGHSHPELGPFCERFGDNGSIPDWNPVNYDSKNLTVPYYSPDTPTVREDIAAQFRTISRLDQGVGLIMKQLEARNLINETLVIFSSDNGSPFPSGRTNLYEPGLRVPLLISNPMNSSRWAATEKAQGTLLDIVPTVLDWLNISVPRYEINQRRVVLTGRSLLPFTTSSNESSRLKDVTFSSHVMHEVTMNYPMRAARSPTHKMVHNLNYWAPFPIDQDFYLSPTFQEILLRTRDRSNLNWSKNLTTYYFRPEFECFDLNSDPDELQPIWPLTTKCEQLLGALELFMAKTNDPWRCSPHAVLQDYGPYKSHPVCMPLGHEWL